MPSSTSQIFWVALGGAAGALVREWALLHSGLGPDEALLLVNVAGSFLIGFILRFERLLHPHMRDFNAVGFCGGLTTVSTWSYILLRLLETGQLAAAMQYAVLTVAAAVFAAFFGRVLGKAAEAKWVALRPLEEGADGAGGIDRAKAGDGAPRSGAPGRRGESDL
ncbi:MAG: CrcB family protein [Deltaproteobacteria bacterium]